MEVFFFWAHQQGPVTMKRVIDFAFVAHTIQSVGWAILQRSLRLLSLYTPLSGAPGGFTEAAADCSPALWSHAAEGNAMLAARY